MSVCSEESETPSIDHKFISKQELQLLNTKCQDIMQRSHGEEYSEANLFFNMMQWSSNNRTYRYNPEVEEATAELQQNKNELLRELQHSTYKRKIKKIHKMNGEQISYIDHYNRVKPQLMSIKNTIDTETTEKDQKHRRTLTKYPELKNHPKLVSYISDQIKLQSQNQQQGQRTKQQNLAIDGFIIPCRLIPIKPTPTRQQEAPPLRVSQIIESKYKNKYMKKGGDMRSNSQKIRTNSVDYRNLCIQQSNIIITNSMLSKQNKAKLSQSLDRILRTVSIKKGNTASVLNHLRQTCQSIKFPKVQRLINRRKF